MEGNLYARVYALLATVPAGHVVSYGELARGLGMPRGARVVGWAMRTCPEGLPWHRVVNARGEISQRGIGEGEALQCALLEDEGVHYGTWTGVSTCRPMAGGSVAMPRRKSRHREPHPLYLHPGLWQPL